MIKFGEDQDKSDKKEKKMSRPYGVALVIAGVDQMYGPSLWYADPSGTYIQYKAKAIGGAHEGAQHLLQEKFHRDMTLEQVEKMCLEILKQVMEEKINCRNVEMACIPVDTLKFRRYSEEQIQEILNNLN